MGVAYFIALDNPNPGFDTFVNGKAIVRDGKGITKLAKAAGLRAPEEFFEMSIEDAVAMGDDFDIDIDDLSVPPEQWFEAKEGLEWVAKLRDHITANPKSLKDSNAVLNDLAEFEQVFKKADAINAKWHFSVDF